MVNLLRPEVRASGFSRQLQMREDLLTDYQLKSRMMGDYYARFREGLGGSSPDLLDFKDTSIERFRKFVN